MAQFQRLDQFVDLGFGVVEAKRRTASRGDAQMLHQRLGAVVPGADRDVFLVQYGAEVVRMHPLHHEADDAGRLARLRENMRGTFDNITPALYEAYHEIVPLTRDSARPALKADIVGRKPDAGGNYHVCLVDLDEGVRVFSRVEGVAPEAVTIGLRVRARVLVTDGKGKLTGLLTLKDTEKSVLNPHACKDEMGRLRVAAASTVARSRNCCASMRAAACVE